MFLHCVNAAFKRRCTNKHLLQCYQSFTVYSLVLIRGCLELAREVAEGLQTQEGSKGEGPDVELVWQTTLATDTWRENTDPKALWTLPSDASSGGISWL